MFGKIDKQNDYACVLAVRRNLCLVFTVIQLTLDSHAFHQLKEVETSAMRRSEKLSSPASTDA